MGAPVNNFRSLRGTNVFTRCRVQHRVLSSASTRRPRRQQADNRRYRGVPPCRTPSRTTAIGSIPCVQHLYTTSSRNKVDAAFHWRRIKSQPMIRRSSLLRFGERCISTASEFHRAAQDFPRIFLRLLSPGQPAHVLSETICTRLACTLLTRILHRLIGGNHFLSLEERLPLEGLQYERQPLHCGPNIFFRAPNPRSFVARNSLRTNHPSRAQPSFCLRVLASSIKQPRVSRRTYTRNRSLAPYPLPYRASHH